MEKNVIIIGDALVELKKLESDSIDMVFADPPYNLGKDYGEGKKADLLHLNNYLSFSKKWIKECIRVLKKGGSIYIALGIRYAPYIYCIIEKEEDMKFMNWINWTFGVGQTSFNKFSSRHTPILFYTKVGKPHTFNLDDIRVPSKYQHDKRYNPNGKNPSNNWHIETIRKNEKRRVNHPTQMPKLVVERAIKASSDVGYLVLDPFAGSGTTLVVAKELGRHFIGIEKNPKYVEIIKNRLRDLNKQIKLVI